jgi:hypothetical protein
MSADHLVDPAFPSCRRWGVDVASASAHRRDDGRSWRTAASTGMGRATAKRSVQEGMDPVFRTGRRKDALDAAVAEIGRNVTGMRLESLARA